MLKMKMKHEVYCSQSEAEVSALGPVMGLVPVELQVETWDSLHFRYTD